MKRIETDCSDLLAFVCVYKPKKKKNAEHKWSPCSVTCGLGIKTRVDKGCGKPSKEKNKEEEEEQRMEEEGGVGFRDRLGSSP